jgi:hypothetical protein
MLHIIETHRSTDLAPGESPIRLMELTGALVVGDRVDMGGGRLWTVARALSYDGLDLIIVSLSPDAEPSRLPPDSSLTLWLDPSGSLIHWHIQFSQFNLVFAGDRPMQWDWDDLVMSPLPWRAHEVEHFESERTHFEYAVIQIARCVPSPITQPQEAIANG